ncbi:hypothetical protein N207_07290 [Helicobacter pylori UM114]|uniref:Uncharacterized protein n=1 Tax=Helicobacter pylori UM114 TaxID=1355531 RepID=T0EU22_HELPX|nr:hypothetical protein N207_07290 [Helicobacter pylori UM114]
MNALFKYSNSIKSPIIGAYIGIQSENQTPPTLIFQPLKDCIKGLDGYFYVLIIP